MLIEIGALCVIFLYKLIKLIMHITHLRRVNGSVMLAVPPAFLDQLQLKAGATVSLVVDQGCLVINPFPQPRYTASELLAASDLSQAPSDAERSWVDAPALGGELL